ncbi:MULTISPECIES: DUF983 domain-containing protein [unclassified Allomuricauda]|uniref:DUF983 domain-containing protein n=1 Tax=unclassified Allomuricauda TaxID=2615049 RepID=UPI00273E14D7|nr:MULTISPECIES: DUF983 domain-containing protein [unclassified Allomuricauda]
MKKVISILKCKCPKCKKGNIFKDSKSRIPFKIPDMNKRCPQCDYKFERETGFFFGAMFVSYALAAGQMIVSLVLFWYLIGLTPINVFIVIAIIAILLGSFNFRLSRAIWIYIFYRR